MKSFIKKVISKINTFFSLRNVAHGEGCICNFRCKFNSKTQMGDNCHFNGMSISGSGQVTIGNNFHSGKNIRILTTFHNWKGDALPYDDTSYSKDVVIGDNVWLGESVMILGGVNIGEGAIIQAGSVVCKDVPPLALAGGHPAEAFKYRDKEHYEEMKQQKRFV